MTTATAQERREAASGTVVERHRTHIAEEAFDLLLENIEYLSDAKLITLNGS